MEYFRFLASAGSESAPPIAIPQAERTKATAMLLLGGKGQKQLRSHAEAQRELCSSEVLRVLRGFA